MSLLSIETLQENFPGESLTAGITQRLVQALEAVGETNPNFGYAVVEHPVATDKAIDKLTLLKSSETLPQTLVDNGVISPLELHSLEYAVIKTISGITPSGTEFLASITGLGNFTIDEMRAILVSLGETPSSGEAPSRKQVKSIRFGIEDQELLSNLGQGPGYVGPFCLPTDMARILVRRTTLNTSFYESHHESTPPSVIADIALSNAASLLFNLDFFPNVLAEYEVRMGLLPITKIESMQDLVLSANGNSHSLHKPATGSDL